MDRRDNLDNRTTPLVPASGAVELDTSDLDVAGVVQRLLTLAEDRGMLAREAVAGER